MNSLTEVFTSVLNMSITATYVAIGVILVRILLRRAPKVFSYALWAVVLFRLLCPVSFTTAISFLGLLPLDSHGNAGSWEYVNGLAFEQEAPVQTEMGAWDSAVNSPLIQAAPLASVEPTLIWMEVLSLVWLAGIVVLLLYSGFSYIKTKRRLLTATLVKNNIYESDQIGTAFVCGFIDPKIYVPLGVKEADLSCILEHERTHIRRKDYLIKPLAFFALILHWFNPFMWLSFALMSRDMEMSCDESVVGKMSREAKGGYLNALLALSQQPGGFYAANPLAFGENHVKDRIKNVLNYKKPSFWVIIAASVAVVAVGIGLFTDPAGVNRTVDNNLSSQLIKYKTEYVGDNSKVGGIISLLTFPDQVTYDSFELFTASEPYGIKVKLITEAKNKNMAADEKSQLVFQDNAAILLALIGNAQYVNFSLDDGASLYSMQYTRSELNFRYGKDISGFAQSPEALEQLIKGKADRGVNSNIAQLVEDNLRVILSSPQESSNPQDYINAHQHEYEDFFKYGGEDALQYMLSQFEAGNAEGLRGQIMMRVCKELLGVRNNVSDQTLSPQEWYDALSIRQEIQLPDFVYDGQDQLEKLVYATEVEKNSVYKRGGFTVVAPKIHASYEEGEMLKVFVTTFSANYQLFGNALAMGTAGIMPTAITYRRDNNGNYVLEKYQPARDGAEFAPSLREYCIMPVSGQEIPGLADKILNYYSEYDDIRILMQDNLFKHLKQNGITDAVLTKPDGEIEFSMSGPRYHP